MKSSNYRKTVAEGEAEWLWRLYEFTEPDDLVLEDLAFARGVIVTEGFLDKTDARLVRMGEKGLIRVKQDIPYFGQKRFAIAHELGHWELHKKESQFFACTSEDMVASYKRSPQEGEANIFAASLLMPSNLFMNLANNKDFSFKTISSLAEYFTTSLTSTAIRYVDLSSDYFAIVCSEAGEIRWWHGSEDFENKFWITPGTKLTTNTIAGSLFCNNQKSKGPEEVDIKEWCDKNTSCESVTFIEDSKYFERYNQIITLLRLP
jgi:predicted transcriptional regulator